MANNKKRYTELAKASIQDNRNVVVSLFENDGDTKGFTIAQQIEVEENGKVLGIFLKDGIHVPNIDGLYELRDALNLAIVKYLEVKKNEEENEWDDEDNWSEEEQ